MGVRDFRELVCWRLSYELKCEVLAFVESGPGSNDFNYRDQIKDSSSSAPSNIAEGFGRFRPGKFARHLEIARALYSRLQNLARAALKSTTNPMLAKKRDAERLKRPRRRG